MMSTLLERWNASNASAAVTEILPCNGSTAWAAAMVARRPFPSVEALLEAADEVWSGLPEQAWQQAFDSHPRIGEREAKAASAKSLAWSEGEQSAANADTEMRTRLAEANRAYEQQFGRIFLVCAAGKSAAGMLAILEQRMHNDAATELHEAAEQQRQITQLRLRKWMEA